VRCDFHEKPVDSWWFDLPEQTNMRNDFKPVIPNRQTGASDAGAAGADFDRAGGSSVRRERGDTVDPAGPKRRSVYGSMGTGGAVTDPSGTTGPVSRSGDRSSTTTGRLRDRDLERSARQGEAPDIEALDIATGTRTLSVPILMSAMAIGIFLLLVIAWWSWPREPVVRDDSAPIAGQREAPDDE
jgi:hypothetical protein